MPIQQQKFKKNVGPKERITSLGIGAGLLGLLALTAQRKNFLAIPVGLSAGYMLFRGATGHDLLYKVLDIDRSQYGLGGIRVERVVTINKPRHVVYSYWRNFTNLPRFMRHLESVQMQDGKSHWVAKAPLGKNIEWDAQITDERPNEYIAWRSMPGSQVENAGKVEFKDAPGHRGTEVHVILEYEPPAGSAGAAFARLFGEEPKQQTREDLRHFKQIMETGEVPTAYGQTSGRVKEVSSQRENRQTDKKPKPFNPVVIASQDSFPASDPPGWASQAE